MKSSTETSILIIKKLQASQQETLLRHLSMLSSTVQEMQRSEVLLGAVKEMEQSLKSFFSATSLLLEIYEKELREPVHEDISEVLTEEDLS